MKRDPKQVLTEWLVLTAKSGDEAAFRDLHQLWNTDLHRMAQIRVGNAVAAQEIILDSWLNIARNLSRLDDPACFPRWAFRIVERRSSDWIRRKVLQRKREEIVANNADRIAPAHTEPPPATDETHALRTAIAQLPADQRELLHLYYELERSVAEIAEILDLPAGTVKSRLFTVRNALKTRIESPNRHE